MTVLALAGRQIDWTVVTIGLVMVGVLPVVIVGFMFRRALRVHGSVDNPLLAERILATNIPLSESMELFRMVLPEAGLASSRSMTFIFKATFFPAHPVLGAFVQAGADHGRGFGLDQLLEDVAHGVADQIGAIARFECFHQLVADRLVKGHRGVLLWCVRTRNTPRITPVAPPIGGCPGSNQSPPT